MQASRRISSACTELATLGTMGWQIHPLAGKKPPPREKLVVSFRSFLGSVAQAAPRPDPVLVAILREGATCWQSLGSATQVRC